MDISPPKVNTYNPSDYQDPYGIQFEGTEMAENYKTKILLLERQLDEVQWSKLEVEHRVTSLENDLEVMQQKEQGYKETISRLEYELNELRCAGSAEGSRLNSLGQVPIVPPPLEFRSRAQSLTHLLTDDFGTTSFSAASLSVGDLMSSPEKENDVFASSSTRPNGRIYSSTSVDPGFSELSPRTETASGLFEAEQQKSQLLDVLSQEVCKCREDLVLANKSISDVNKKIQHFIEISSQCPLRSADDNSLPPHIRGFCVEVQQALDDRVWDFSECLLSDHQVLVSLREQLDFYEDFSGLFWSVVSEWNRRCRHSLRASMMSQLLQACSHCQIPNPLHIDELIPATDTTIIEVQYPVLAEYLLVTLNLIYLRDSGLLANATIRYILETNSQPEQLLRFLDILPIFGPRALDILMRSLRRSDQGHIAEIIAGAHPGRFQDTPDTPPPQARRYTISGFPPRVEKSVRLFPQQNIETKAKKNFFRRPKWLFRSGKYQFKMK